MVRCDYQVLFLSPSIKEDSVNVIKWSSDTTIYVYAHLPCLRFQKLDIWLWFATGFNVQDDETTLLEEEEMAKADSNNPIDEVKNNLDVSYFFVFIDLAFRWRILWFFNNILLELLIFLLVYLFIFNSLTEIAANSQILLLQKESEIPLEELLARYTKVG